MEKNDNNIRPLNKQEKMDLDLREDFFLWLLNGNAKKYSVNLSMECMDKISDYVVDKKIACKLWEIVNPNVYKIVFQKIIDTKLLRIKEKHMYKIFGVVGQRYLKFLKEKPWKKGNNRLFDMTSLELKDVRSNVNKGVKERSIDQNENLPDIDTEEVILWLTTQPNANGTLYLKSVIRSYMSALRNAPKKLILDGDAKRNVFACHTVDKFDQLWNVFKSAPNYIDINHTPWHGQLSAGMAAYRRYLVFLEQGEQNGIIKCNNSYQLNSLEKKLDRKTTVKNSQTKVTKLSDDENEILSIFKGCFPISMRIGYTDITKLKVAYKKKYQTDISLNDEALCNLIRRKAVEVEEDRYTHMGNLVSTSTLEGMYVFIEEELSKNIAQSRVYIKPLFKRFQDDLSIVVDEMLLLKIIGISFGNFYKTNKKSMCITSRDNEALLSIGAEISEAINILLREDIQPYSIEKIAAGLPGYPRDRIEKNLNNGIEQIVLVDGNEYAHIDYVYIDEDVLKKIENIINEFIFLQKFISFDELLKEMHKNVQEVFEYNEQISEEDIIKVIKIKLRDRYQFEEYEEYGECIFDKKGV